MKKPFPRFWFEGNYFSGWVESPKDIKRVLNSYMGTMTFDEVLDTARNRKLDKLAHDYSSFGLRSEYTRGNKTLRQFLTEHNVNIQAMILATKLFLIHTHAEIVHEENPDQIVYKEKDVINLLVNLGHPVPEFGD